MCSVLEKMEEKAKKVDIEKKKKDKIKFKKNIIHQEKHDQERMLD